MWGSEHGDSSHAKALRFGHHRIDAFDSRKLKEVGVARAEHADAVLRLVAAQERIRPMESQGGTWDAFFWVADILALHAEFVARGATIVYGPIVQEACRMREFAVRDPDGHVLGFGEALES